VDEPLQQQQQQLAAGKQTGGCLPKQHTPIRWRSNQLSDMVARGGSPGAATITDFAAAAAADVCSGLGAVRAAAAGGSGPEALHSMQELEGGRHQGAPAGHGSSGSGTAAGAGQALLGHAPPQQQQQAAGRGCSMEVRQELGAGNLLHR
jgi:hypothetical protein